jgi:hypothetical protein
MISHKPAVNVKSRKRIEDCVAEAELDRFLLEDSKSDKPSIPEDVVHKLKQIHENLGQRTTKSQS